MTSILDDALANARAALFPTRSAARSTSEGRLAGSYHQLVALSSGRLAMIDDGLGFQLVLWSPCPSRKQFERYVSCLSAMMLAWIGKSAAMRPGGCEFEPPVLVG